MEKVKTPNRYLDMVDHPAHVKKLTVKQLGKLAEELREELINGLAKHGGHIGSPGREAKALQRLWRILANHVVVKRQLIAAGGTSAFRHCLNS